MTERVHYHCSCGRTTFDYDGEWVPRWVDDEGRPRQECDWCGAVLPKPKEYAANWREARRPYDWNREGER